MRYRLRADRLATLLQSSRLSQNHWALKLGLSRGHWSDIVNGRHPYPSAKTRQRMLEGFGVELDELFAAEAHPAPKWNPKRAPASTNAARESSHLGSRHAHCEPVHALPLDFSTGPARRPQAEPASPPRRFSMSRISDELRQASRSLRRDWRFALGVILTLGLGVGLGVPVLALADEFFLRPPPGVSDAARTVRILTRSYGNNGPWLNDGLTGLDYSVLRRARSLSGVAAWATLSRSLGRGENARPI